MTIDQTEGLAPQQSRQFVVQVNSQCGHKIPLAQESESSHKQTIYGKSP